MDIGGKKIDEKKFCELWLLMYNELDLLQMKKRFNGPLVYNIIYQICTSGSGYNDILYWKIGDIMYSRCKLYKNSIEASDDYILEYTVCFEEYSKFIEYVDNICVFLNDCISDYTVKELGYMLWERGVVRQYKEVLFLDIYRYQKSKKTRISAILSLLNIIPDRTDKLKYYREFYEKTAFEELKKYYSGFLFQHDILEYSYRVANVISQERREFDSRFINESVIAFEKKLAEILFPEKNQMIKKTVRFITETLENNEKSIENIIENMKINRKNNKNPMRDAILQVDDVVINVSLVRKMYSIIKKREVRLEKLVNTPLEKLVSNFSCFYEGFCIVKEAYAISIEKYINTHLGILESSLDQLYKVYKLLNFTENIFPPEENDFKNILEFVLRYGLGKTRPSFISRLCNYIDEWISMGKIGTNPELLKKIDTLYRLVNEKDEFLKSYLKQMENRILQKKSILETEKKIAETLFQNEKKIEMILNEAAQWKGKSLRLINRSLWGLEAEEIKIKIPKRLRNEIAKAVMEEVVYDEVMSNFMKCSTSKREKAVYTNISHKYDNSISSFATNSGYSVTYVYNLRENISKQEATVNTSGINIEDSDIPKIEKKIIEEDVYVLDGDRLEIKKRTNAKSIFRRRRLCGDTMIPEMDGGKISLGKGEIQIHPKYSFVKIRLDRMVLILDLYQYAVIEEIVNNPEAKGIEKMKQSMFNKVLEIFTKKKIVRRENEKYTIDRTTEGEIDLLNEVYEEKFGEAIDVEGYLQTLVAKTIKKHKRKYLLELETELYNLTQICFTKEQLKKTLLGLECRGVISNVDGVIEYLP